MNTTYVTAFYDIYDKTNDPTYVDQYLDNFLKFAQKGYPCILYLDSTLMHLESKLQVCPNVKVIYNIQFNDLPLIKLLPKHTVQLPPNRNVEKDTYEYLILMNSKLHLIMESIKSFNLEQAAWIDFGIGKILKDADKSFAKLIDVDIPSDKILIPGCIDANLNSMIDLGHIYWRFCGGLLFGKRETFKRFNEIC